MTPLYQLNAARGAALAAILLAGLVAARWLLGPDFGSFVPGLAEASVVGAGVLFIASVTVWFMAAWPRGQAPTPTTRRGVRAIALLLAVMPLLMLFQAVFSVSLGIDVAAPGVVATAQNPHPGRMSPNACVALLLLITSLALLAGTARRVAQWLVGAFIGMAVLIALLGILGYLLHLEQLYRWGSFNRLTLPNALGLAFLALALWELRGPWSGALLRLEQNERRITRRSLAVLAVVAVAAGAGGFAALGSEFERARKEDVRSTAGVTAEALVGAMDNGLWLAQTIATRAVVVEQVAKVTTGTGDGMSRERLRGLARNLLTAGVTGARFVDTAGNTLAEAGHFAARPETPTLALARDYTATGRLVWSGGFVLVTELPLQDKGEVIGRFHSEQRLALMDRLVARIRDEAASSDVLICNRMDDHASCLPSKLYAKPFDVPMFEAPARTTLPVNRALLGESGVVVTRDLRGVPVVAAFMPLGRTGLGMVVKADIEAVFATLRQRLGWLALVLAAMVLAGTWALRQLVRPLVKQLATEQARYRAILDNSNDAFIGMDGSGNVTDWNACAERMFGYTRAEAMGRRLSELIIPPETREAHEAGMARFRRTGRGKVVNQQVEVVALHRDGRRLEVELSVAAMPDGEEFVAHAFVRDVADRKAAERLLSASEQRMRDITNAMPAMAGVFDMEERCVYANDLALKAHALTPGKAIGISMREALGERSYALHEPHVRAVLQGERRSFEGALPWRGGMGHFQVHLVPMYDPQTQAVSGFYLMTFDITALRSAQLQQERGERRLRSIADNVPALISHLDADGRYLFANRQFDTLLGVRPEQLLGHRIDEVRDHGYVEQIMPWLHRAMGGETVAFESETVARDGEPRKYQQTYVPEFDDDNRVIGVYAVTFDITERKLAEQRVSDAQAHLKAIADNLPVLISYIDREHRLTFVNKTFQTWMGVDPEQVVGSHLKVLLGPERYSERLQQLGQALGGERIEFESLLQALDVKRHLHTVYVPDVHVDGSVHGIYALSNDVTAMKDAERRLEELARNDALTGLPNRREFETRLVEALARARRNRRAMGVIFMDVDHFKSINDSLGHAAGDVVLKEVASRIRATVRVTDTAARLAGDEFVVILEGLAVEEESSRIAAKLVAAIRAPMTLPDGREIQVTTSVGMACWGGVGEGAENILDRADRALYRAKAAGRDTFAQTMF